MFAGLFYLNIFIWDAHKKTLLPQTQDPDILANSTTPSKTCVSMLHFNHVQLARIQHAFRYILCL